MIIYFIIEDNKEYIGKLINQNTKQYDLYIFRKPYEREMMVNVRVCVYEKKSDCVVVKNNTATFLKNVKVLEGRISYSSINMFCLVCL